MLQRSAKRPLSGPKKRRHIIVMRVSDERALWLSRAVLPHEPALRAWLKRKRVIDLDIDDVVQEAYAKLAALDSVAGVRDPRTYVFQVAYSIVVSHVRRSRIVSIRAMEDVEDLGTVLPQVSPERQLEDRDELNRLAAAIAALPPKCRETLLLRRVEGLSQKETAKRLGVSEKAVEKNMARSLRALMDIFGRGGKSAPGASRKSKGDTAPQKHGGRGEKP